MAIYRNLRFWSFFIILATLSSFTIVTLAEGENSKSSEEQQHTDVAKVDASASQEDNKEKRSQEEIMFGNQQNRPNGLVDDLMSMSENTEDSSNGSQAQDSKSEEDEGNEARSAGGQNDMMMQSGNADWDAKMAAAYQDDTLPMIEFQNILYDPNTLEPIRGQRLDRPIPLRKRSLRSSLGQMIQKRGIRLPRRSMRLKRQVDVQDLLNLFENERFYNEEQQVTPHIFSGRARTVAKRHVPGRYSNYPETPEYRYPYVFQHRDNGILSNMAAPDMEEAAQDNDMDDLMLLPPNSRYVDAPQEPLELFPYGRQEDKNEGMQRWLNRHTVPSVFRVSKRSPFFYPIDYRYIPASGFKKRSSNGNGHVVGRYLDEESEPGDFGKWGHVVQVPEAYASPEDITRLYGLANLLSEGDEVRKRRSV